MLALLLLANAVAADPADDPGFEASAVPWVKQAAEATTLKGYAELRGSYTDAYGTPWLLVERLRPTLKVAPSERFSFETTLEIHADQGRYASAEALDLVKEQLGPDLFDLALAASGCTEDDVAALTERHIDGIGDVVGLDRLFVDVNLPVADLRIGRQAVSWGSALVFNPTDVFAEVIVAEPWRERKGVDAARLTVPIGQSAQVLGVIGADGIPDGEISNLRGGLRGTLSRPKLGASAVAFTDGERSFAGVDLKGDAGVGWWLEGGYNLDNSGEEQARYAKVSAGADYSFAVLQVLYVAAQLSYDGAGVAPEDYDFTGAMGSSLPLSDCATDASDTSATSSSARATMGRLYGVGLLNWSLTEDLSASATTLWNLEDGTGLVFPSFGAKVGGRLSLNVGAQFLLGKDGEFRPDPEDMQVPPLDLSPLLPTWTATAWARWAL